jgi:hypothetical protein
MGAQAQTIYIAPRVYAAPPPVAVPLLPPGEVLRLVRIAGLTPLTQPALRGPRHYVLLASDRAGGQMRVLVSAVDGRIVRVSPAYDPRFAYQPVRPPGVVPLAPRTRLGDVPPPSAPGTSHLAGAPPETTGALPKRPARTPLPRPRPQIASADTPIPAAPPQTAAAPSPAPQSETAPSPQPEAQAEAPPSRRWGRRAAPTRAAEPTPLAPVAPLE